MFGSLCVQITVVAIILSTLLFYFKSKVAFAKQGMPFTKVTLIQKVSITHNTRRFRFALKTKDTVFGLPIGNHVLLRFFDANNDAIIRPYSPTSSSKDVGFFEIVVKIYSNGVMGQYLDNLAIGDTIDVKGPTGHVHYDRPSHITVQRLRKTTFFDFATINMIAGGTGLTPMYQIIQSVITDPFDRTKIKMIYGNRTEDDILCREDLEKMRQVDNVDIVFTIGSAQNAWKEEVGRVTSEMIGKYMAPPEDEPVNLLCGPPAMTKAINAYLKTMGYPKDRIITF